MTLPTYQGVGATVRVLHEARGERRSVLGLDEDTLVKPSILYEVKSWLRESEGEGEEEGAAAGAAAGARPGGSNMTDRHRRYG